MNKPMSAILRGLLIGCAIACATLPSAAFKPYGIGHWGITKNALDEIRATLSTGETIGFRSLAKYQIMTDNCLVDLIHFSAPVYHFTDDLLSASSDRLIKSKERIISLLTMPEPDGLLARKELGEALHTLQDFYAHSNWVETGNTGANLALGRSIIPNPGNAVVGSSVDQFLPVAPLSTGYFIGWTGCGDPPSGKCRHGSEIPIIGVEMCSGIHKDFPRDGRPYAAANASALDGSIDYVRQIVDALSSIPDAEARDKALTALFGAKSVAFVIDVTGSMGDEIDQVKAQVRQMVERMRDADDPPSRYVLVPFSDPCDCEPIVTSDPNRLIAEVDRLYAWGGDDCPEYSMTALLKAVNESNFLGKVYLFTDATAKDQSVVWSVVATALRKLVLVSFMLTGSCSPIDPAYYQTASATGGQVYLLHQSEIGSMFALVDAELQDDLATLLIRRRRVTGQETMPLPIDESVREVTISLALEDEAGVIPNIALALLRPDGSVVDTTDPQASILETTGGMLIRYRLPQPGSWSLKITGSGLYTVRAFGSTSLGFDQSNFAEMAGTYAHDGFFPLPGQPTTEQLQTSILTLRGQVANPTLEVLNLDGSHHLTPDVFGDPLNLPPNSLAARFSPPPSPFRLRLMGLSPGGHVVIREVGTLFRGQSLAIEFDHPLPALIPGIPTRVRMKVRNVGNVDTVTVTALSTRAMVSAVTPLPMNIPAGAERIVEFDMLVPDTQILPPTADLSATVSSIFDVTSSNSASADLSVLEPLSRLELAPQSVVGGRTVRATVQLAGPAQSPMTVHLSSNRDVAVTYPRTIVVPTGSSSASFDIRTRSQRAPITIQFTARIGARTRSANLTLTVAPRIASFTVNRRIAHTGQSVVARLTLAFPAGSGGVRFDVSSSSRVVTVPSAVTVPEGSRTVEFSIRVNQPEAERKAIVRVQGHGQSASVEVLARP